MRYPVIFTLIFVISNFATSYAAPAPKKDSVAIDQEDYTILITNESSASSRPASVLIIINTKFTLVSQAKAYLRAAINLEGEKSFNTVFATEAEQGSHKQEIKLNMDRPKQKTVRVVVWLDKEGAASPPHPLASDNIAFEAAAFLNTNNR